MAYSQPGKTRERVYQFVRRRLEAGDPPTVREVQEALGFRSAQSAQEHLEALVEEGALLRSGGRRSRGFRLPEGDAFSTSRGTTLIPLLGRVQAGAMTTAVENIEGYLRVEAEEQADTLFGLRVRGESMRDAGILPGDLLIVRSQSSAPAGSIVVALAGEEATVKRLVFVDGRAQLHPENPDFEPIIPDSEEFRIIGKVVEVRRSLEGPYGG
ncbi:MAG: transcriptional repressor LexA [Alkalispirochaetaceae bacterium]